MTKDVRFLGIYLQEILPSENFRESVKFINFFRSSRILDQRTTF